MTTTPVLDTLRAARELISAPEGRTKLRPLWSIRRDPEHWTYCLAGLPIISPHDDGDVIEDKIAMGGLLPAGMELAA